MRFITSLVRLPPQRPRPALDTELIGPRLVLRAGDSAYWHAWHELRDLSRDSLIPWEPQWPEDSLSYGFYCSVLRRQWRDWRAGRAYAFTIFTRAAGQPDILIGGITLSDVQYGAEQKGTVGYWLGTPFRGNGYMVEALGLVNAFAFDTLRLQRIEASCMPTNGPSKAVLERSGFVEEGFARDYLQINGKREDHLLWGLNKVAARAR